MPRLHRAIMKGHYICAQSHLDDGDDVNQTTPKGWTPLHVAFHHNRSYGKFKDKGKEEASFLSSPHTKITDLLIQRGAEPRKDDQGRTPLMCMFQSRESKGYNACILDRYIAFEASYYKVSPEKYRRALDKLFKTGFKKSPGMYSAPELRQQAIDDFWGTIESEKNEQRLRHGNTSHLTQTPGAM